MSDGTGGRPVKPVVVSPVVVSVDLAELIAKIWDQIIGQVNKLIDAHDSFGYVQFNAKLNPSLPEMLEGLSFVDFALNKFIASGKLEHDEHRNVLNSKQCILKMRSLALALDSQDQAEYERIMAELKSQPKF